MVLPEEPKFGYLSDDERQDAWWHKAGGIPNEPRRPWTSLIQNIVGWGAFLILAYVLIVPEPNQHYRNLYRAEGESTAGYLKIELRSIYARTHRFPLETDAAVKDLMNSSHGEFTESVEYKYMGNGRGQLRVKLSKDDLKWYSYTPGVLVAEFDFHSGASLKNSWDDE